MDSENLIDVVFQPWILLLTGILTTVYIFLTWNFKYWEKQGVKGSKPWPLVGTMANPFTVPFDIQDQRQYKIHGKVFGTFEGRNPALIVGDPELLKTILVKDFTSFMNRRNFPVAEQDKIIQKFVSVMTGEEWRELRNIITPTFTTGKIKQMICLIDECTKKFINILHEHAAKNEAFDSKQCISAFTMDVVASCAFGTKIDYLNDPNNEFLRHGRKAFNNPPKIFFLAFLFPKLAEYLPPFMPRESLHFFQNLLNKVISVRKQETMLRKDFLQLLMEAKIDSERKMKISQENGESSKFVMTHDHILAQAMIFLLAGFETTALTLSFTFYNLLLNPDIQEKLISEIDSVLKKHEGIVSYETIGDMQYVDMVISETLRMYPPVIRLERTCTVDDYNLNGIILKKGMIVGIPTYAIHHDEDFYPEPTVFNPDRFSPENRSKINPYTYLPFGYGPRNCIGMRFAVMEMKIALVSILRNFRVKRCAETQIPFKRQKNSAFLQMEKLLIKVEPRTDKV